MAAPLNKQAILQYIQDSYAAFEAGLASLDAGQMTAPVLDGGWSVKDTLAHLSVWHRRALDVLDPAEPPRVPGIPASGIEDASINQFNARFYAAHKDQPLDELLDSFRESYRQVLAVVERMTEADLMSLLRDETRLWQVVAGNTYEHYPEHLSAIRAAFAGM